MSSEVSGLRFVIDILSKVLSAPSWTQRKEEQQRTSLEDYGMEKPPKEIIRRQHFETQLPEVCGIPCSMFHAVCSRDPVDPGPMYLKLDDTWHRFYLDAAVLFWEEGTQPDRDNDIWDGNKYVDWGQQLSVVGVAISEITMKDSELTIRFDNGAEVSLKHMPLDDFTSLLHFAPAGLS
jgi:hypothetical protein